LLKPTPASIEHAFGLRQGAHTGSRPEGGQPIAAVAEVDDDPDDPGAMSRFLALTGRPDG
jgi:hypothetical protein